MHVGAVEHNLDSLNMLVLLEMLRKLETPFAFEICASQTLVAFRKLDKI